MRSIITIAWKAILLLMAISCTSSNNGEVSVSENLPTVLKPSMQRYFVDSLYLENAGTVFLETNPNSFINRIDKLYMDEGLIYIFDRSLSKIVAFSRDGRYIGHLHRIGKGPMEYTALIDIDIDTESKKIHLLSDSPFKIMTFDYDFNFESEISVENHYLELLAEQDYFYCRRAETTNYIPNENYLDIVNKKDGNVEQRLLPIQADTESLQKAKIPGRKLTKSNAIFITTSHDNSIYELKDENLIKRFVIAFDEDKNESNDGNKHITNTVESDRLVMFTSNDGLFILDKESGDLRGYTAGLLNTGPLYSSLTQFLPVSRSTSTIAFIRQPAILKMMAKSMSEKLPQTNISQPNENNTKFLDFVDKIDENSNPILFFYNF